MIECKNCETSFEGKFCPNCSQKAGTHRLTLGHFAHDATHAVTHTDTGIFLLIKELFIRPGVVGREYVSGKRKKYFNPITFLLIMMAIHVFVVKKTDFYPSFTRQMEAVYKKLAQSDPKRMEKFQQQMRKADQQTSVATDNSKVLTVIFIPILALLTWLFFRKSNYNYAENLVFNVFINGQMIVWFLLLCVLPFLIEKSLIVPAMYIYIVASWIYCVIAYKQFYQQGWGRTIWKGLTIQIGYYTIVTLASEYLIEYFV